MSELPWFKRGDHYYDILREKLMCLSQGPESVFGSYQFSSVAAASESAWIRMDTNATDLETDMEHLFFQWFMGILKKGLVYVQYPMGEEIWTTDKLVPNTAAGEEKAYMDNKLSPFLNPHPKTEFFIIKGVTIGFKYYNTEAFALSQKLRFLGAKFRHDEVKVGEAHPLTGIPVTEEELNRLKALARPIYTRRIA